MLVLTRKKDERFSLTLPDGTVIWVQVTRIRNRNVSIGIEAPREVKVLREEVKGDGK